MNPTIPLLGASGQAAGLFPGRGQGSPGDTLDDYQLTGSEGSLAGAIGTAGNAHVHVAALVIAALVGVIVLHGLGFRFAFDASVGR